MTHDERDIELLIVRYLDGSASDIELASLNATLAADPGARRFFVRASHQAQVCFENLAAELDDTDPIVTPAAEAAKPTRGLRWTWIAAAVLAVAAIGVIIASIAMNTPKGTQTDRQPALAVLTGSQGVSWRSEPLYPGDELSPRSLDIEVGSLDIDFNDGTTVTIDGPAEFGLLSSARCSLRLGRITVRATPGFVVEAPRGVRITDLGTVFRVEVGADGTVRTQVLRGSVRLSGAGADDHVLAAGRSATVFSDGRIDLPAGFTAPIPIGNLFDDATGAKIADAIASDEHRAAARRGGFGVERVAHGGDVAGTVQPIAPGIAVDLGSLGWSDQRTGRPAVNDAWGPQPSEGTLSTTRAGAPDTGERLEQGVGMHANQLLTLDLDAIAEAGAPVSDGDWRLISERAGLNDEAARGDSGGSVHLAVLISDDRGLLAASVDGKPVTPRRVDDHFELIGPIGEPLRDATAAFDVPIPRGARYLTLVCAAGDGAISVDHGVFSGLRLVYQSDRPRSVDSARHDSVEGDDR